MEIKIYADAYNRWFVGFRNTTVRFDDEKTAREFALDLVMRFEGLE